MVDEDMDAFNHIGRRRWDLTHFNFDGDPIYNIEVSLQEKGVEFSYSED
jgi:hypothetical protein